MDFTIIGAFWALSILLSLTPGPDWACCIAAGLKGHRVMPAVAGLITGHTVMMLTVAFGAGRILAGSPALMTALTAAGAIYLLWFGVGCSVIPAASRRETAPGLIPERAGGSGVPA